MESLDSPYLEAIQRIEGSTPGEKYKVLNKVAAAMADLKAENPDIDPILEMKSSFNIPDPLIPLVHVEVSKILKNSEGIIEALKSEDPIVFERALTAKWFFDGTNPDITNVKYYENYIFPHLSLNNRIKLVKKLAIYLSSANGDKSIIADDFYAEFGRQYGRELVEPLLIACSELFIKRLIIEDRRITLSSRLVKTIYEKYPNVIIKYLKLSKSSGQARVLVRVNIFKYRDFLPLLLKSDINSFIELIEMHNSSLGIKFSRNRTDLFMKKGIDALIRNPRLFLPMMTLKVTTKLNKSQFKLMFKNLFPMKIQEFKFQEIFGYLEYYEEEKMALLLSTFQDIYHVNLLDCDEQVIPKMLKLLPVVERVKLARKKLKKHTDWHLGRSWSLISRELSWRCYLPTDESIPWIKSQISKSSEVFHRRDLLKQMIHTCFLNNDEEALLETLKYISTRHKSEQGWILLEVLGRLMEDFQVECLSSEHWKVLNDMIQLLSIKNELQSKVEEARNIIIAGIHFNLINNLSIDDKINLLIEINSKIWYRKWNILQEHPNYEKKCLETFLRIIGDKYPGDEKIWNYSWTEILISILQSLYYFNERNSENLTTKLENLSLRNYPWMLESIKKILNDEKESKSIKDRIAQSLKDREEDVYDEIVPDELKDTITIHNEHKEIKFDLQKTLVLLKRNPEKIKENWESYLEELRKHIDKKLGKWFMRLCRWHQELPINFVKKMVSNLMIKKDSYSLVVLALLYEGTTFEHLITPLIPKSPRLNPTGEEAKIDYSLLWTGARSFNLVAPPVSLDLIFDFCVGRYIHTTISCLASVGRRVSVDKVIPFTIKLMNSGVSIKKHAIRLFIRVASIDEMKITLTNLLRNEKDRSMRTIMLNNIRALFIDEPNEDTWAIMREAIEDLKPDDNAITSVMKINEVPDEFIADYVRLLINAIRKLESMENGFERKKALSYFNQLINSAVNFSYAFPEELHEFIVDEYFGDLSNPDYALSSAVRYFVVQAYLKNAGGKLEKRLERLSCLLREIIEKYWNNECKEKPDLLLGNHMVYALTQEVIRQNQLYSPIMKSIVQSLFDTIFSLLKPQNEPTSYLYLTYASLFEITLSSKEFAQKIVDILPTMIEALSKESLSLIACTLHRFLGERISRDGWENTLLDFIENLVEFENDNSTILTSMMLFYPSEIIPKSQFWRIVNILQTHHHPAVISNVYICINHIGPY